MHYSLTMKPALGVKYLPVLSRCPADLYDVGDHVPVLAGDLMPPGDSSIAEVAALMRARIYAGEFDGGSRKLPTRLELQTEYGLGSAESAGMVLRALASEGLVSLEQGRGTYALSRGRYAVTFAIPAAGSDPELSGAAASLKKAAKIEAAVKGAVLAEVIGDGLRVSVSVEAPGPAPVAAARAAVVAALVVRAALADDGSWDLAGASVEAHPAGGDGE
jgi:Bacterial regulatory proteins, gntR family